MYLPEKQVRMSKLEGLSNKIQSSSGIPRGKTTILPFSLLRSEKKSLMIILFIKEVM